MPEWPRRKVVKQDGAALRAVGKPERLIGRADRAGLGEDQVVPEGRHTFQWSVECGNLGRACGGSVARPELVMVAARTGRADIDGEEQRSVRGGQSAGSEAVLTGRNRRE